MGSGFFSVVRVEVSGMRGGFWGEKNGGVKLHFSNLNLTSHCIVGPH